MTQQELDARIHSITSLKQVSHQSVRELQADQVKDLVRDVIKEVTPRQIPETGERSIGYNDCQRDVVQLTRELGL